MRKNFIIPARINGESLSNSVTYNFDAVEYFKAILEDQPEKLPRSLYPANRENMLPRFMLEKLGNTTLRPVMELVDAAERREEACEVSLQIDSKKLRLWLRNNAPEAIVHMTTAQTHWHINEEGMVTDDRGNSLALSEVVTMINHMEVREQSLLKVLNAIPPCPDHGHDCVPHAVEWVEKQLTKKVGVTIIS
ncbi:hypothetical protein [Neptuniibacter sp. QD37_11]|uniref:hypothetical protein n=1 Tax=Neptuniibacter sp. QD37_11 TaxID=3398209 RepID=UPI0039F4DE12